MDTPRDPAGPAAPTPETSDSVTAQAVLAAYERWALTSTPGADEQTASAEADAPAEASSAARSAATHLAALPDHVAGQYLTPAGIRLRDAWTHPDEVRSRVLNLEATRRNLIGLGVDPDEADRYAPLNALDTLASVEMVRPSQLLDALRPQIIQAMADQLEEDQVRAERLLGRAKVLADLTELVATAAKPPRTPRRPKRRQAWWPPRSFTP